MHVFMEYIRVGKIIQAQEASVMETDVIWRSPLNPYAAGG